MINQAISLAKSAMAKANNIESGTTTTIDARVSPLSQSLGITYDTAHNVVGNQTNDDITDLQTRVTNTENNKLNTGDLLNEIKNVDGAGSGVDADLLDGKQASEFTLQTETDSLNNRLTNLENRLADYETHKHNYIDSTINDTDDGSGTQTDTTKTTGEVV